MGELFKSTRPDVLVQQGARGLVEQDLWLENIFLVEQDVWAMVTSLNPKTSITAHLKKLGCEFVNVSKYGWNLESLFCGCRVLRAQAQALAGCISRRLHFLFLGRPVQPQALAAETFLLNKARGFLLNKARCFC